MNSAHERAVFLSTIKTFVIASVKRGRPQKTYLLYVVQSGCRIDGKGSATMTVISTPSASEDEPKHELTPEESGLVDRLRVFATMRWIAVAGVLIVSLLATQVFGINFPLLPVYLICTSMALYNLWLLWQARRLKVGATGSALVSPVPDASTYGVPGPLPEQIPQATSSLIKRARSIGNIHIALDLVALTVLLHFTGGIENPFIFFFVFHVIIAGVLLHYRVVYVIATAAMLLVILLVSLEFSGVLPHVHLAGFTSGNLYRQQTYILGILTALASCLYGSAYMVSHTSGELRKRQREVVTLREHRLAATMKELEEASKGLTKLKEGREQLLRFLAIASHDLKAPLSAIQSYFGVMLGGFAGEMPEKQRHMIERSSQRIKDLLNLISDLLDISRIEAGQIVQEMEEVSLSKVVADSVEDVRSLAKGKGIELNLEMPKSLPQLRASGKRLQQVITNLLDNAIKFTPEKGTVKLRVTDQPDNILVEVMDTGVGIASEDMPRIFDDFYRGKNLEKAGSGLGLSIARRIVEAHGGRIWAESPNPEDPSGRGSKFSLTLRKSLVPADAKETKPSLAE